VIALLDKFSHNHARIAISVGYVAYLVGLWACFSEKKWRYG